MGGSSAAEAAEPGRSRSVGELWVGTRVFRFDRVCSRTSYTGCRA